MLAACGPTPYDGGGGTGGGGAHLGSGGSGTGGSGGVDNGGPCPTEATFIYTVDENSTFSQFNPANLQFRDIGRLNCPSTRTCMGPLGPQPATPFSMSVDRQANAWVLYCSGELFRVDARNAQCTTTMFQPDQNGFEVFGMGFVADQPMLAAETLFVTGGALLQVGMGGSSKMGTINFSTLQLTQVGQVGGWPELTGTGDAELWGFFPDVNPPKVARIDKGSGNLLTTYAETSIAGMPHAWAFAFWGDGFWIFLQRVTGDPSTSVYHLRRSDGNFSRVLLNTGRVIVGAGVSTCAPIVGVRR
jgi:hypothetical protein